MNNVWVLLQGILEDQKLKKRWLWHTSLYQDPLPKNRETVSKIVHTMYNTYWFRGASARVPIVYSVTFFACVSHLKNIFRCFISMFGAVCGELKLSLSIYIDRLDFRESYRLG